MPLVLPLPELTVFREFWLPCGVRLSSVREAGCVLLWWEEAGEGTSVSALGAVQTRYEPLSNLAGLKACLTPFLLLSQLQMGKRLTWPHRTQTEEFQKASREEKYLLLSIYWHWPMEMPKRTAKTFLIYSILMHQYPHPDSSCSTLKSLWFVPRAQIKGNLEEVQVWSTARMTPVLASDKCPGQHINIAVTQKSQPTQLSKQFLLLSFPSGKRL